MKEPYKLVRVGKRKYRREHRVVMEKALGHPIPKGYDVHHINKDTEDNRIENLLLLPKGEHRKLHAEIDRQSGKWLTKEEKAEKARANARQYRATHHEECLRKGREHYRKNHEKLLEQKRLYREAHREELRQKALEYKRLNPEKVKETNRKSRQKNAEKRRAYSRRYAQEHREEVLRKGREYGVAHREELREKNRVYREIHKEELRARKKRARENMTEAQRERIRLYHREYYRKYKNIPKKERTNKAN